ncbi:hypothetical protein ACFXAQ_17325, partial [Streptomyces olivaceus]|uniref:hypothetical protein n=1 Tax=Streptomyces olivaceus TaxID=47716 RepID=UPI0036B5AE95
MTKRERWALALWLSGGVVVVWAVVHFGFEPVTAALGIGGTLLVASPARTAIARTWAWNAERSDGTQLDAAATALAYAVERHWAGEASRRRQRLAVDRGHTPRVNVHQPPPPQLDNRGAGVIWLTKEE